MKRKIVVEIDCEDERCGNCEMMHGCECMIKLDDKEWYAQRGPACRAAEKKLRDLVEAGEVMRDSHINHDRRAREQWDRALAALEEP